MYGRLTPITAGMKLDCRTAVLETDDWDDVVAPETRAQWLKNLWKLYKLDGMMFQRARMPEDAVDKNMRLICAVDAATNLKIVGVWAGFRCRCGDFSCQLLIGTPGQRSVC